MSLTEEHMCSYSIEIRTTLKEPESEENKKTVPGEVGKGNGSLS